METTMLVILDTLSLLFAGDIMQHSGQIRNALIPGQDTSIAASYDYSPYFRHTDTYIAEADFAVANMEFALAGPPYTGYPSFSAPETLAEEAAAAGIDLFLCANNHICDKGKRGLRESVTNYGRIGIPYTGLYRDSADQAENYPYIADIRGCRIAFINFTYGTNGIPVAPPFKVNRMDMEEVSEAIAKARSKKADYIIALPHWGTEYDTEADGSQERWKEFLIGEGVDAIIGTHPHMIQPVVEDTLSNGKRVVTAFSLGNFISNMSLSGTELGLMFRLDIKVDKEGKASLAGYRAIPVWCSRPGGFCDSYTVLPVKDFLDKGERFKSRYNYDKMKKTYERLKHLFEDGSDE